jgi:hypothetical protein
MTFVGVSWPASICLRRSVTASWQEGRLAVSRHLERFIFKKDLDLDLTSFGRFLAKLPAMKFVVTLDRDEEGSGYLNVPPSKGTLRSLIRASGLTPDEFSGARRQI